MASLGFNFDSNNYEPAFARASGYKLPLGINKVKIVDCKSASADGKLTVSINIEKQVTGVRQAFRKHLSHCVKVT